MMYTSAKTIIDRLLKQSDMGMLQGQNQLNKRDLHWVRFDRNSIGQRLAKLPDAPKRAISKKLEEFDGEFRKMDAAQKKDYAGMLWVAYAEDRAVSDDTLRYLNSPDAPANIRKLAETAKFVQQTGIQLPPNNTPHSAGTKYWISLFGYAYKGIPGFEVMTQRGNMNRQIKPYTGGNSSYPQGPLVIAPYGEGFRPIIRSLDEIPVFAGQAAQNTRQFFKGNQLMLGKGVVYVPPKGHQNVVEDYVAEQSEPDITGPIAFHIDNGMAHSLVSQQPSQAKFIFGIYADENGCLFLRQRKGFKGRGSAALSDGENVYMNPQQIAAILEPSRLGTNHIVRPASKNEAIDYDGLVKGTRLVYTMSPDSENRLNAPNPQNQLEWAVSAQALQQLRNFLDMTGADKGKEDVHTSFEGFYILMVGPKFIRAKNLGEGKAVARPFVDPKSISKVENPVRGGEDVIVDRDVRWVVVSNSISESRRVQNERYYQDTRGNKKTYLDEWTVVDETDDPQSAVDKMVQVAAGKGGNIPRINAQARSLDVAQKALEEAKGVPAKVPLQPKPEAVPQANEAPQQPQVQNVPEEPNANMAAVAKSLIRRLT